MKRLVGICCMAIAIGLVFYGCGGKQFGANDIAKIRAAASTLAEKEIERFQPLEYQHKDEAMFYQCMGHPIDPTWGVYAKAYREFTGSEIKDITMENSLERPIKVIVSYNFDVYATDPAIPRDDPEGLDKAQKVTNFILHHKESKPLVYYFDFDGNQVGDLPEQFPRVSYYQETDLVPNPSPGFQ